MTDKQNDILRERALRLSRVQQTVYQGLTDEALVFRLLPEWFAIPALLLVEVLKLPEIAHMPGMPQYVTGVFHRKGKILPAINLKVFFNFPKPGLTPLDKLLLVQTSKLSFGLVADEINGLRSFPREALRQPAIDSFGGTISGLYEQHIALLDLEVLVELLFAQKKPRP